MRGAPCGVGAPHTGLQGLHGTILDNRTVFRHQRRGMLRDIDQNLRHTARIKLYPGDYIEIMAAERPIFRESGWEPTFPRVREVKSDLLDTESAAKKGTMPVGESEARMRAIRRARARVRDIALANEFRWFVTLTLSPEHVDRYDAPQIIRKLNSWCDNQVRRHGLRYVLVPEHHKDGAVHFHGFFRWDSPKEMVVDSGTLTMDGWKKPRLPRSNAQRESWLTAGARIVYNLPSWSLGYTTAIEVYGEYSRAVGYVCKYIGKSMDSGRRESARIGGRWYYSGGQLRQPEVMYAPLSVGDVAAMPGAFTFAVEDARMGMALWRGSVYDYKQIEKGGSG